MFPFTFWQLNLFSSNLTSTTSRPTHSLEVKAVGFHIAEYVVQSWTHRFGKTHQEHKRVCPKSSKKGEMEEKRLQHDYAPCGLLSCFILLSLLSKYMHPLGGKHKTKHNKTMIRYFQVKTSSTVPYAYRIKLKFDLSLLLTLVHLSNLTYYCILLSLSGTCTYTSHNCSLIPEHALSLQTYYLLLVSSILKFY